MFKVFPCNGKIPLISGWQELATTDQEQINIWAELYRGQVTNWGIPTGRSSNILVLDVDVKPDENGLNGYDTLKKFPFTSTLSQRTPSGGLHLIYAYPEDGRTYGNRVKFEAGCDTRGDGGYILYYGFADQTPIAHAPAWLLERAIKTEVPRDPTAAVCKISPEIAGQIIQTCLDAIREAPAGESNNVLNVEAFKMGQLVASQSITKEYAEAVLFQAAKARGKPDYEARATIASGLDGGTKKPIISPFGDAPPTSSFPLPPAPGPIGRWTPANFSREDLLNTANLKKPQLFQDWSTEDIHITTADGGTGKTTLKLFEAICLAIGDRFLGFNCIQPGKTLFITGEDTAPKLGAMIGQIVRQMGLFENFPGNEEKIKTILASIVVKKDADLCLIVKDRQGFIHPNSEAMRKVLEAVEDIKPKMIVFDPISSFWGSESALNDMNKAVTKFMSELVERYPVCVEMINHMGKSSSANKDMSQFAGRGGSGLPSNSRVSRVLRPLFEDEYTELTGDSLTEKQSAMMCNVNKFTDGSPLFNKPFVILRDGYLFSRKVLSDIKVREFEKQQTDVERVFTFIKEARTAGKYPSQAVVVAHFAVLEDSLSKERVSKAVTMLGYEGHMGERAVLIDNPDQASGGKVFVITDKEGKEF
jgi:hypothetical protein